MTRFIAGVLGVIAVGVMLVAYGLLSPRASAYGGTPMLDVYGRALPVSERVDLASDAEAIRFAYASGYRPAAPAAPRGYETISYSPAPAAAVPFRTVQTVDAPAPRRVVTTVERAPQRNWKKTALVIGGSTAAGAGVGGIVGGKKGALIGAAIGGGGSTLWEALKKN